MAQFYSDPARGSEKWALPDCEVFWDDADEMHGSGPRNFDSNGEPVKPGWYYWLCFPGCLPDSDAFGPYESEQAAIDACRETHGE